MQTALCVSIPGWDVSEQLRANGGWHPLLGKQCANPGDPENGRAVVLTDLLFGSKVNYTCDKG